MKWLGIISIKTVIEGNGLDDNAKDELGIIRAWTCLRYVVKLG